MNTEHPEAVKSVSAGTILLWIVGVLAIIGGLGAGYISVAIAGIILLPITNTLVKKYGKVNFSGKARVIIAFFIVIGGVLISNPATDTPRTANTQPQANTETAPQEEVWTAVMSFSGKGNQNTESFDITGKKVRVTATTTGSRVGSFSGVDLQKENGGYTGPGLSISTEGTEDGSGQTTYRNLAPGRYYIQVISGINWKVTVEQTN